MSITLEGHKAIDYLIDAIEKQNRRINDIRLARCVQSFTPSSEIRASEDAEYERQYNEAVDRYTMLLNQLQAERKKS